MNGRFVLIVVGEVASLIVLAIGLVIMANGTTYEYCTQSSTGIGGALIALFAAVFAFIIGVVAWDEIG